MGFFSPSLSLKLKRETTFLYTFDICKSSLLGLLAVYNLTKMLPSHGHKQMMTLDGLWTDRSSLGLWGKAILHPSTRGHPLESEENFHIINLGASLNLGAGKWSYAVSF